MRRISAIHNKTEFFEADNIILPVTIANAPDLTGGVAEAYLSMKTNGNSEPIELLASITGPNVVSVTYSSFQAPVGSGVIHVMAGSNLPTLRTVSTIEVEILDSAKPRPTEQ